MKNVQFRKYIDTMPEGLDPSFVGFGTSNLKVYSSFSKETKLNTSDVDLPRSYSYLSSSEELFLCLRSDDDKIVCKLSSHLFENVSKFKALNFLMYNLEIDKKILGISDLGEYSIYDQKNNSLRSMIHLSSAFFAGIDEVKTYPYDHFFNSNDEKAQRLVKLSFDVLNQESHLGLVNDPLKGSYYVESRADQIARATFSLLKKYDEERGDDFLNSATVKSWVAKGAQKSRDLVYKMEKNIPGINNYINFEEILNEAEFKSHPGTVFSLEKIRTKIQSSGVITNVYCFGELKDYLKNLTLITNIYNSLGIQVKVFENEEAVDENDFHTTLGEHNLSFSSQEISKEVLLSKNLDLVLKELNKNERFIAAL